MNKTVTIVLASLVALAGCTTAPSRTDKFVTTNGFSDDATNYTMLISKARFLQRRCPDELQLSTSAMIDAMKAYPSIPKAANRQAYRDSIDMNAIARGIDDFEAAHGLRGAPRAAACKVGKDQIARGTAVGKLLVQK